MTLDELNAKAMEMIVTSGQARAALNKALDALLDDDYKLCDELMEEAKKNITASHTAQTKVLQGTAMDEEFKPNILFTHAQDNLMTVMSEINVGKQLIRLYKKINNNVK